MTSHTLFKTRSPENTAYWLNTHAAVLFDVSAAIARNKLSTQIHVKSYRRNFEGKCRAHSDFLKFFPQNLQGSRCMRTFEVVCDS